MLKRNARNQSGRASTKPGLESICCSWLGWRCIKCSCPDASHMSRTSSSSKLSRASDNPQRHAGLPLSEPREALRLSRNLCRHKKPARFARLRALLGPCTGRQQSSHRSQKAGFERGGRTCKKAGTCGASLTPHQRGRSAAGAARRTHRLQVDQTISRTVVIKISLAIISIVAGRGSGTPGTSKRTQALRENSRSAFRWY